jgi:ubiquitin-like-conjugating enzyme ATG3
MRFSSLLRQNKQPLTPTQVFQDVPSDHAFKTMTMETFPHSGQLLASVHPCKHASVMKKFIDRMDDAKKNSGDNIINNSSGSGSQEDVGSNDKDKADKKKKGWGLGGVVRKVTGGSGSGTSAASAGTASSSAQPIKQEEVQGVQVDFYMVIVSIHFEYTRIATKKKRLRADVSGFVCFTVLEVHR